MEQESYREFCASFWTYVRSEDGVDTRESRTQEVLKLRIEQVFLMEPHDLAAMLSCCVTARGRYVEFADQFADSEPAQIIAALRKRHQLPLIPKPDHSVQSLLAAMLESEEGLSYYHEIAMCLSRACDYHAMRPHLCGAKESVKPMPSFEEFERDSEEASVDQEENGDGYSPEQSEGEADDE